MKKTKSNVSVQEKIKSLKQQLKEQIALEQQKIQSLRMEAKTKREGIREIRQMMSDSHVHIADLKVFFAIQKKQQAEA